MEFISVIIPTFNRKTLVRKCVDSLLNQNFPRDKYEIIVVDDGSTDGTDTELKSLFPDRIVYIKQENGGPAKARNRGIREAKGGILAFTDDDCIIDKNWLSEIKKAFEENSSVLWVNGDTIPVNQDRDSLSWKLSQYIYCSKKSETNNIAYKRQLFDKIGFFDESIPIPAYEDVDMKRRIEKKGFQRVFNEKAIVMHPYENEMEDFAKSSRINGMGLFYYCLKNPFTGALMFVYEVMYMPLFVFLFYFKKNPARLYLLSFRSLNTFKGFFSAVKRRPGKILKDYRNKTA